MLTGKVTMQLITHLIKTADRRHDPQADRAESFAGYARLMSNLLCRPCIGPNTHTRLNRTLISVRPHITLQTVNASIIFKRRTDT